jgi:alpha-galactosidase
MPTAFRNSVVIAGMLGMLVPPAVCGDAGHEIWMDDLDVRMMEIGWGEVHKNASVEGNALQIGGRKFYRGVGTHAVSTLLLRRDGDVQRFRAQVGVDDESGERGTVQFFLLGDKKVLWDSGVMKKGDAARGVDLVCSGITLLGLLVLDGGDGIDYDHADWCDARFTVGEGGTVTPLPQQVTSDPQILTPPESPFPRINGAGVFGARPGNPVHYTIAATGERPMWFSARNLPTGLRLDSLSGQISGVVANKGEFHVELGAHNRLGDADRPLHLVVGDTICLTPPIGWNSWNCWGCSVDEGKIRSAAEAMVQTGLINHGWSYVNIDDCWEIRPGADDPVLAGESRDSLGRINTNRKFPDMKQLCDDVHALGLKIGVYSSPGELTCAGFTASLGYEEEDAVRFAEWGIDYLKYDWCSYGRVAKDKSRSELQKPYVTMRSALDNVRRDIVYSLCQYGMGDVWEWGQDVGGNCWRTTGDITDSWQSMAGIGFGQEALHPYAGPGHWNDPDMLVVGRVGWGPDLHTTRLTPDEQYTHITLWSLLAAPLLLGCDLSQLDDFTRSLLTNDEVLAVNQDPLGKQARRILQTGGTEVWSKPLHDGSLAVGLFYPSTNPVNPAGYFHWTPPSPATVSFTADDLGIDGAIRVRDLWRQKDIGVFDGGFSTEIPYHGTMLLQVTRVNR